MNTSDGKRIAFISNETGDTSLWLFHYFGGKLEPVKVGSLVYKRPMGKLRVRVLDKGTGRPMPARVHLMAADGRSYAPPGSWFHCDWHFYPRVEKEEYHYFHTDGNFEIELPIGMAKLFFSHGFEYLPQEKEVTLDAAKPASLTVTFDRLNDLPAKSKGWWDGDNHFHMPRRRPFGEQQLSGCRRDRWQLSRHGSRFCGHRARHRSRA